MVRETILRRARGKIKDYENLDYIISCFERRKEKEFVDYVRHQSCDVIFIENDKQKVKEGIIYYIKSGNAFSGFGAEYTQDFIYSENEPVNGETNPFEYYYLQPSKYKPSDVNRFAFIRFCEEHRKKIRSITKIRNAYELSDKYIDVAGEIVEKYIKLNDKTNNYIKDAILNSFSSNFEYIGVHYRGTDFKVGYKQHPYALEIQDFFLQIDELLLKIDKPLKIFIATDEKRAIDMFVQRYKEKVIYFDDVFRSEKGEPVHFSESERKQHKYNLGLEILRDIIALARCEYLVAGLSQVSCSARIIKASRKKKYKEMRIINKGIKQ